MMMILTINANTDKNNTNDNNNDDNNDNNNNNNNNNKLETITNGSFTGQQNVVPSFPV